MSFPAILRNPGVTKFVQSRQEGDTLSGTQVPVKKARRDEKEGKRWIRRDQNGNLPSPCFFIMFMSG